MGFTRKSFVSVERIVLTVAFALILSDVIAKTDVLSCQSTQECLTISECRKAQKKNNLPPDAIMNLSSSFLYPCEDFPTPKICCTVRIEGDTEPEDPGYTITYEDSPQASEMIHVALPFGVGVPQKERGISPTENCGLFKKGSNEENAAPGQFPWLALLGNKDKDSGDLQFHCGGTLINDRYILTSAYCIENMSSPPEMVRLGEYDQSTKNNCQSESQDGCVQDYEVEKIIMHESYSIPFLKNDICLVRLKGSVFKFTENIRPICLPTETLESGIYTIAGWGINEKRNVTKTSIPKFGTLTLAVPKECELNLPIPVMPVAESQLCAGKSASSCFGDAGGALIGYTTKQNVERAVQVGIISYAGQCNSAFTAELYTNVAYFMDWIVKNTSE